MTSEAQCEVIERLFRERGKQFSEDALLMFIHCARIEWQRREEERAAIADRVKELAKVKRKLKSAQR